MFEVNYNVMAKMTPTVADNDAHSHAKDSNLSYLFNYLFILGLSHVIFCKILSASAARLTLPNVRLPLTHSLTPPRKTWLKRLGCLHYYCGCNWLLKFMGRHTHTWSTTVFHYPTRFWVQCFHLFLSSLCAVACRPNMCRAFLSDFKPPPPKKTPPPITHAVPGP